jgi:hypothetical protein
MAINKMTGKRYFSKGGLFVGASPLRTLLTATLSANGAVAVDASMCDAYEVTLAANATSVVISNPSVGQELTLLFKQDATGSRTVAWPTAKYAGGAAPTTSTTAAYVDSVTFNWDGTSWQEKCRSIGNH